VDARHAGGPEGCFAPCLPFFWGIWNFSKSKDAPKSLLMYQSQPLSVIARGQICHRASSARSAQRRSDAP
jgi:hypothetical protein